MDKAMEYQKTPATTPVAMERTMSAVATEAPRISWRASPAFLTRSAPPSSGSMPDSREARTAAKLTRYGYDCYAYCMLAAGYIDAVIENGLKPFDIAALIPIVTGAGGGVCAWDGGDPSTGGRVLAYGDPRVRDAAIAALARA